MILALAGGVGGAMLAQGLAAVTDDLAVIVNTADDFELYGLHISPDLDTVMYTLAGIANPATGWGIAEESWGFIEMLARYGEDAWFRLGDRDMATHVLRTTRLRAGHSLTEATAELAAALGIRARLLPMCNQPVSTLVNTPDGWLGFQDYFVRRRHQDRVVEVSFSGIENADLSAEVDEALRQAEAIVFCPSNPIVSIGPILSVGGMRELLAEVGQRVPIVAVSPIVGGKALKGPAAEMLSSLGHEVSALGVARLYAGLVQGMVIDTTDTDLQPAIAALGMRVLVAQTVMGGADDRARLAREVLNFT
jgi:LPPG:FO 2-phospho-L-lactate transferase